VDKSIWNYQVDDVIAAVPPHWHEGITEEHGSRWAGAAMTIDSRSAHGAPARTAKNGPSKELYKNNYNYKKSEEL
jgi:hypothetical protein